MVVIKRRIFDLKDLALEGGSGQRDAGGLVKSPMFAKISSIAVKEGQQVRKNDILMVVEAMKMEHALRAPKEGTVKFISPLTIGEMITEGNPILTID